MKRTLLTILVLVLVLGTSCMSIAGIANPIEGYQEAKWGMSVQEVEKIFQDKEFEEAPYRHKWSAIMHLYDSILDQKVEIRFYFDNNQLLLVTMMPVFSEGPDQDFWSYENLLKILTAKYGVYYVGSKGSGATWEDREGNQLYMMPYIVEYKWGKCESIITEDLEKRFKEDILKKF